MNKEARPGQRQLRFYAFRSDNPDRILHKFIRKSSRPPTRNMGALYPHPPRPQSCHIIIASGSNRRPVSSSSSTIPIIHPIIKSGHRMGSETVVITCPHRHPMNPHQYFSRQFRFFTSEATCHHRRCKDLLRFININVLRRYRRLKEYRSTDLFRIIRVRTFPSSPVSLGRTLIQHTFQVTCRRLLHNCRVPSGTTASISTVITWYSQESGMPRTGHSICPHLTSPRPLPQNLPHAFTVAAINPQHLRGYG